MSKFTLEVCADSVESVLAAEKGGADRIELCGNVVIGGTTPSESLFREIRRHSDIKIHALIRPRFGDFLYTQYEHRQMLQDIRHFAQAGADGVVIGSLNADGTLNTEQMQEMMEAAGSCAVTMHRAFDVCADPFEALKKSAELGVDTILTSGQEADCLAGYGLLKKLMQLTDQSRSDSHRVTILAGAGVTSANIAEIAKKTGVRAFHMSGKRLLESGMRYRNERVHMGLGSLSEFECYHTDEAEIRRAAEILRTLGEDGR